jgi:hypothetical protein
MIKKKLVHFLSSFDECFACSVSVSSVISWIYWLLCCTFFGFILALYFPKIFHNLAMPE